MLVKPAPSEKSTSPTGRVSGPAMLGSGLKADVPRVVWRSALQAKPWQGIDFNSAFRSSVGARKSQCNRVRGGVYKAVGPCNRKIGEHSADGEAIHQSAVDRHALAECRYQPGRLTTNLAGPHKAMIVDTSRIARGTALPTPALSSEGRSRSTRSSRYLRLAGRAAKFANGLKHRLYFSRRCDTNGSICVHDEEPRKQGVR